MRQVRAALTWLTWAFLAALVVQFFFAGAGAFGATDWEVHSGLGFALVPVSLAILVLAALARRAVALSGVLFGLMVVQIVLANSGAEASPWIGALHGVNALVVFGLAMMIAVRGRRVKVPTA